MNEKDAEQNILKKVFYIQKMLNNTEVFLELVRAGLWENLPVHGEEFFVEQSERAERMAHGSEQEDWGKVYQLAEGQSVVGLVLAGIEHSKVKPPQELLLQWIGEVQMLEQQNKDMNAFIGKLMAKMQYVGIYALLLKGQGIALCYERPLWRVLGDVDLFLSDDYYEKAKAFIIPLASCIDEERLTTKHFAMNLDDWEVELHGTLRSELWGAVDNVLDDIKKDVFYRGKVSSWMNNKTQVFLLAPNENVVYVFSHILQHFFRGGIGLRQICDWCRLLWTYRDTLNYGLLEQRLRKMGVMTEWKAFAALAVNRLGIPLEAMPLFNENDNLNHDLRKKAERIMEFVLETGNFGHNRDVSYQSKHSAFTRKMITLLRQAKDSFIIMRIFPLDAMKSLYSFWKSRIKQL